MIDFHLYLKGLESKEEVIKRLLSIVEDLRLGVVSDNSLDSVWNYDDLTGQAVEDDSTIEEMRSYNLEYHNRLVEKIT